MSEAVQRVVLSNGLTLLMRVQSRIPKVASQMWYRVGSAHERSGERGIAHLLEHMVFKGTTTLSESDIDTIVQKLAGYTNAFTSYDYTGYIYDFPAQYSTVAINLLADSMRNCVFDSEHLASEMKAVIQELRMFRDDYQTALVESLITAIFRDHPYRYPIIGYKQDLWSITSEKLHDFYKRYYAPNNGTLVIVGDIDCAQIADQVEKSFGNYVPTPGLSSQSHMVGHKHFFEGVTHTVTLYRTIEQPLFIAAYVVPGARADQDYFLEIIRTVVGSGRGSRLYQELVEKKNYATDVDACVYNLFDYGILFVVVRPCAVADIPIIREICEQVMADIALRGITVQELERAMASVSREHESMMEYIHRQAQWIGAYYLATGNPHGIISFTQKTSDLVASVVQTIAAQYLHPVDMHTGVILPLPAADSARLLAHQSDSDAYDELHLSGIQRQSIVAPPRYAHTVHREPGPQINYAPFVTFDLANGTRCLVSESRHTERVVLVLEWKADHTYDPDGQWGCAYVAALLFHEGTTRFSAIDLAIYLEVHGFEFHTAAGWVSLTVPAHKLSLGVELLTHIILETVYTPAAIEKVKLRVLADLAAYWDDPMQYVGDIARQKIYNQHPYAKSPLGNKEDIQKLSLEEMLNYRASYITPQGARCAIVGACNPEDAYKIFKAEWERFTGSVVPGLVYPVILPVREQKFHYAAIRDQIALCFAGKTVARDNKDFDPLIIFDQIFTGGRSGGMGSRLFGIRSQTGLFYAIGGSLVKYTAEQPGMIFIKTLVSQDSCARAQGAVMDAIRHAAERTTTAEIDDARYALIQGLMDSYETNLHYARTILSIDRFNLGDHYLSQRADQIMTISESDIRAVAQKYLQQEQLITVTVGRAYE